MILRMWSLIQDFRLWLWTRKLNRLQPRLADPIAAIQFAIKMENADDAMTFLNDWNEGDLTEWYDFDGSRNCTPTQAPCMDRIYGR